MSRIIRLCFRFFPCQKPDNKYNSACLSEMICEQAAAFGLSSIVYVPKIELDTVTELSAFCEKASMVQSLPHYFRSLHCQFHLSKPTYAGSLIRVAWLHQHYRLAQCSFNKLLYRPHFTTAMLKLWNQNLTHRYEAFMTNQTICYVLPGNKYVPSNVTRR